MEHQDRLEPGRIAIQNEGQIAGRDKSERLDATHILLRHSIEECSRQASALPLRPSHLAGPTFERFALRRGGESDALHGETGTFERPQDKGMLVVGYLAYDNAVDDRRIDAHRRCSCGSAHVGGNQRAAQRCRSLPKMPAIQRRHASLRLITCFPANRAGAEPGATVNVSLLRSL
jgi:hypothetical protein